MDGAKEQRSKDRRSKRAKEQRTEDQRMEQKSDGATDGQSNRAKSDEAIILYNKIETIKKKKE